MEKLQNIVSEGCTNLNWNKWSSYNSLYQPFPNGTGDDMSIVTGEIPVTLEDFLSPGNPQHTQIAVYRQLRLLTGVSNVLTGLIAYEKDV